MTEQQAHFEFLQLRFDDPIFAEQYDNTAEDFRAWMKEQDFKPLCPKCGAIMSQADYHLSNEDYYAVCLDCDEDFYSIEVKEWTQ